MFDIRVILEVLSLMTAKQEFIFGLFTAQTKTGGAQTSRPSKLKHVVWLLVLPSMWLPSIHKILSVQL